MDTSYVFFVLSLLIVLSMSYAHVIFDIWGDFKLKENKSYLHSPYWLSIPYDTKILIIVFQVFALLGLAYWIFWTASNSFSHGPLQHKYTKYIVISVFMSSSILWPYMAYNYVLQPTFVRSIGASIPLWVSALSVLAMLAFTFEARADWLSTLSVIFLAIVVVLFDGIGWSAQAIYDALH